jgi:hypothetical protein
VQEWAQSNGLTENLPWRLATAFPTVGIIVMMASLKENFLGTTTTFLYLGLDKYQWVTETDARAVKHLVLHEIAHLRGIMDEPGADNWAYDELLALEG